MRPNRELPSSDTRRTRVDPDEAHQLTAAMCRIENQLHSHPFLSRAELYTGIFDLYRKIYKFAKIWPNLACHSLAVNKRIQVIFGDALGVGSSCQITGL